MEILLSNHDIVQQTKLYRCVRLQNHLFHSPFKKFPIQGRVIAVCLKEGFQGKPHYAGVFEVISKNARRPEKSGRLFALFFKSNTYSIKTPSSYGTLLPGGADDVEKDFNYRR